MADPPHDSLASDAVTEDAGASSTPLSRARHRPPLPAPETWPQDLRTSLSLCVADDLPVAVAEQPEAGIALAHPDGRLRFVNDRFCQIVGRERSALLGQAIAEITHPEDWPGCLAQIDQLLRGGEPFHTEKRYLRPDGSSAWIRNTVSLLRDAAGRIDSLISVAFDFTEQRRIEDERREDQRRQKFLLHLSDTLRLLPEPARIQAEASRMLCEFLEADRVVYAEIQGEELVVLYDHVQDVPSMVGRYPRSGFGPAVDRLMRRSGTYVTTNHFGDPTIPPDAREALREIGCAAYIGVVLVREPDLNAVFAVHSATPRRWTTGEVAVVEDVADRIWVTLARARTEASLEESERRLRGLLEGLPQLVWRARDGGEWTWTSPQWTRFTGLGPEQSYAFEWLAALPEEDRAVARAAWRDADTRDSLDFHHRLRHAATGQDRWFHSRALAVRDAQGTLIEWLGTSTDVDEQVRASEALTRSSEDLERRVAQRTADLQLALATLRREGDERRRVEERLLQSEKLKAIGQLSGGIAHDFNNLLQVLTTGLEVMRRNLERGQVADMRKDIERAQRATRRAAALTQRLLAFGRQQHLSPRPVTFDQIARDIEEMLRRTVGPGVQVDLQLHASNWQVECDVGQMESALLNLCVNARDAMPDGGWLTVSTAELTLSSEEALHIADAHPGRYACIAVSDTGMGMSEDLQARVFEPFFTTKPLGRGTGLGLSQIYGFVRQSGGLVQLYSRVGEGTTVRLMLPFHSHASDEDDPDDSGRRTVLLVEDEDDVREITASTLRSFGYKVLEANDGPTALRLVKSAARVDALVCDYGLPGGMNGQQVIDAIHEVQPAVATILATGYASGRIRPGVTVLRKPFEIADLANCIESQLQSSPPC